MRAVSATEVKRKLYGVRGGQKPTALVQLFVNATILQKCP
jgi:hypothetical protein